MTSTTRNISASLESKLDAIEAAFADLHKSAIAESQEAGYSPAFRLVLRIEDLSFKFHKLITDLRGTRNHRAAA